MIYIYVLKDPDTQKVRYVGKAANLTKRFSAHLSRAKSYKTHVYTWINSLLKQNKVPVLEVVEKVKNSVWQNAERKWIKHYKGLGCDLTNVTNGGEGGATYGRLGKKNSVEHIEKTRQGRLGKPVKRTAEGNKNRAAGIRKYCDTMKKPVQQYTLNGNFIQEWDSAVDAGKKLNITHSNITRSCKHETKNAGGYKWRYKNDK